MSRWEQKESVSYPVLKSRLHPHDLRLTCGQGSAEHRQDSVSLLETRGNMWKEGRRAPLFPRADQFC